MIISTPLAFLVKILVKHFENFGENLATFELCPPQSLLNFGEIFENFGEYLATFEPRPLNPSCMALHKIPATAGVSAKGWGGKVNGRVFL